MSTIQQVQTEIAEIKANVTGVEAKLDAVEAEIAEVKAKLNAAQEKNEKEGYLTALRQEKAALDHKEATLHQEKAALHQEKAALTALLPKPELLGTPVRQCPAVSSRAPRSWVHDTAQSRSHIIPRFASRLSLQILSSMQSPSNIDYTFARRFLCAFHHMADPDNHHENFLSLSLAGTFAAFLYQYFQGQILCCHQLPGRGASGSFSHPSVADMGFVHSLHPSRNYLYAHLQVRKSLTFNLENESLGYSVHSPYLNAGAFIAIVCDLQELQLCVHVFDGTSTMAVSSPLFHCRWSDTDSVASFLSGFRAGIEFLHQLDKESSLLDAHYCNSQRLPCPRLDSGRDFTFLRWYSDDDVSYRVYRVSNYQRDRHDEVWKFFDGYDLPNLVLVQTLLDEFAQCDNVGGEISILKYSFREDNGGWTSSGVKSVIHKLHTLHSMAFVHGDIRQNNLLLEAGYIIDFDIARRVEESPVYTHNFNSQIPERHADARPGFPMKPEHDCYSLGEVLRVQGVCPTICELVKKCSLLPAIAKLSGVEEDVHISKKVHY